MGRSESGSDAYSYAFSEEQPEHTVTVSDFVLDKYEVSLGRFRKFMEVFDGTPPAAGAGAHPLIAGTGWQDTWPLAASQAELLSSRNCSTLHQWTDIAGSNESKSINCVNWYEAFAFCAWDGGRLPTEAEWEYAAAGGTENRLYPWGSSLPTCSLAGWIGCATTVHDVGTYPLGAGRWGHRDLSGNVWEWTFDWHDLSWYSGGGATCRNCTNNLATPFRVRRGGGYNAADSTHYRVAFRQGVAPVARGPSFGLRCARSAP